MGATIGSVIPTETAVIPSAVGVDIGCGMAARRLRIRADQLPDAGLDGWVDRMRRSVPAGLGRWHGEASDEALTWLAKHPPPPTLARPRAGSHPARHARFRQPFHRAGRRSGPVGSGSCCTPASWWRQQAGDLAHEDPRSDCTTDSARELEDPELAWLQQGTPEFDAYIRDLAWSQAYARREPTAHAGRHPPAARG